MRAKRGKQVLIFGVLIVIIALIQLFFLGQRYFPELEKARRDIGKSSAWRGVNSAFSGKIANYLEYVARELPPGVNVLAGSQYGPVPLSNPTYLQFFLSPHYIFNCHNVFYADCAQKSFADGDAVLVTSPELLSTLAEGPNMTFNEESSHEYGLLYNGPKSINAPKTWTDFSDVKEWLKAFVPPVVFISILFLPWLLFINTFVPDMSSQDHIAIAFGLAVGSFSFLIYLGLIAGAQFDSRLIASVVAIIWLLPLLRLKQIKDWKFRDWISNNKWPSWLIIIICLILVVQIFLSVGLGYHRSDEYLLWGAKAYGIASDGLQIGASDWGTTTSEYPLNIPLLIATFFELFGDKLPESKLWFPLFNGALILAIYGFFSRRVTTFHLLGTILIVTTFPFVFLHGTLAYANLPFSFYLITAILLYLESDKFSIPINNKLLWISGAFFALSAWTRPEGLSISLIFIFLIVIVMSARRHIIKWDSIRAITIPIGIFALTWHFGSKITYLHPGISGGLVLSWIMETITGNFQFEEANYLIGEFGKLFLSLKRWGATALILIIFSLLRMHYKKERLQFEVKLLFMLGFVHILIVLGGYYHLTFYPGERDLSWWISTGLDRMLMPGLLLISLSFLLGIFQFSMIETEVT